jgi:hypothetical protein
MKSSLIFLKAFWISLHKNEIRDVFKRGNIGCGMSDTKEISLGEVGVFELVKAFREILASITAPQRSFFLKRLLELPTVK